MCIREHCDIEIIILIDEGEEDGSEKTKNTTA